MITIDSDEILTGSFTDYFFRVPSGLECLKVKVLRVFSSFYGKI